jgi:uncharacterized protein YuzE
MTESEVRYDAKADVLYLFPKNDRELTRSIGVSPGIPVEFGDARNMLGVEILWTSKTLTGKVIASLHAKQARAL